MNDFVYRVRPRILRQAQDTNYHEFLLVILSARKLIEVMLYSKIIWPAQTLDPIAVLQRATSVLSPLAEPDEPAAPGLKLKPAIDAYTSAGAWGSFDEQRKGTIAPGMLADLVVLSSDLIELPETLDTASVAVTIFDGKIVHRAAPHALTAPAPSLQH